MKRFANDFSFETTKARCSAVRFKNSGLPSAPNFLAFSAGENLVVNFYRLHWSGYNLPARSKRSNRIACRMQDKRSPDEGLGRFDVQEYFII